MVAVGLCIAVLLLVGMPLERRWGSPIFALFVLTSIPLTAQAYRVLDGSSGVPWSGSAGLAGTLLGAYFIRSLGGQLPMPGWVLLPAWIATEAFVVRGFWIDEPGSMPWATVCAAVGLGAATAGALRLLNVEARVDSISASRRSAGPNPVVLRADRMRSAGDPYQAFDLIQTAAEIARADPSIEGNLREELECLVASAAPSPPAASPGVGPVESGDVLSHWNDPSALAAVAPKAETEPLGEEALFGVDDLETPESGLDFGLGNVGADQVDPQDDETDSDLTPLMDVGDDGARTAFLDAPEAEARTAFFTALEVEATPVVPATQTIAFGQSAAESGTTDALAPASEAATTVLTRRALKAVAAIPVTDGDDWIEIDADGRGKSRLPLHRIQAIAIGAVGGLGPRPVLVIDFVLNWAGDAAEPLKSIRVRGDRFDPMAFSPDAANPLEALTRWIGRLESRTAATCLPNREILVGTFGRFADLATYERDVLLAETPR